VSGSGVSWAICKSAPHSRQTTTPAPHHSVFTGRMPFLLPNQQRQSTEDTEGNTIEFLVCGCYLLSIFLDSLWVCQQRTVAVWSVLMLFCHTVNNVLTPKDRVCYKNWCKISSLLCSKLFTVNNFFTNMMWCFNCYLQVSLFFLSSPSAAVCL